ncbi:hypothetical protein H310_10991 [Aphanomyces invadans]|uniref:Uncharacterized protein n=1 Tax=Aphanomyces invadans TaxID=157072 RepID=A0A024TQD0_9STRA|nr:hypothetical protein H310_10991 [Aphanomyces invadans]ETV95547.1 hypothetical protein H310_10991 [Aphanomyces invadans]|eukprot:XP_008875740.1 hypothetical protein H310_10991 [Aphanomyces invadans]
MDELLGRIVDGDTVSLSDMEGMGLKHVFMEVIERIRVEEEVCSETTSRFRRLLATQATILAGFPHDKRAPFLEDALSMLLRKTQPKSPAHDEFVLDLIQDLLLKVQFPGNASPSILRQSKSIVGCILAILGTNMERLMGSSLPPPALVEMAVASLGRCCIPFDHLVLFARWKVYRSEWMNAILPNASMDTSFDDELDEDCDEEHDIRADVIRDTNQMLSAVLPDPFGLKYLGEPSWPDTGLAVMAYWLALAPSLRSVGATTVSFDVFAIQPLAPYIETLVNHPSLAAKRGAITLTTAIMHHPNPLALIDASVEASPTEKVCGLDTFARLRLTDRLQSVTPLLRGVLTALVVLPNAPDRAHGLAAWQLLVDCVSPATRFDVLAELARTCPFPNCVAIVVDRIRGDIAKQWGEPSASSLHAKLVPFLTTMLRARPDQEFVRHSDAIASALSLLRFLLLRDKATRVLDLSSLQPLLQGQWRRLKHLAATQASLEKSRRELKPSPPPSGHVLTMTFDTTSDGPEDAADASSIEFDLMRLYIMDAAFEAAMDAFL